MSGIASYLDVFMQTARSRPSSEALVFPDARRTYFELVDRGASRAALLSSVGVGPGDRFGVLMENGPEFVELLLGAAILGATMVPINIRFKARELDHVIGDAELTAVLTTGAIEGAVDFAQLLYDTLPGLAQAADPLALSLPDHPHLRAVVTFADETRAGLVNASALDVSGGPAARDVPGGGADAPLLIMYTSGTTANPKGCVLTSGAMALNAKAIVDRLGIEPDDVWWDPLPLFHMGGAMLLSSVFAAGGRYVSQAHFTPEEAISLIEAERPTVLYPLFPTISLDLIHHPGFADCPVDRVMAIGSVAPPDLQRRIQDAVPAARLFSAYGITELCGCVCFHSPTDPADRRLRTCGRPLAGFEMRVVDPETNASLPAGAPGELVGRGAQMFKHYYGNPKATADVMDAEGFFHTGDLCSIDDRGEISYHGRIKDMLKVGGENVSAIEVESFLATHPAVKMAQVVGVPDERLLEVAAAFVELAPGQSVTEEELIVFCEGRIARFKIPRHVRFVTEWPMSATKVQKFRLRDRLIEDLAPKALSAEP
jgi:fatty-acyl-CoA synthase